MRFRDAEIPPVAAPKRYDVSENCTPQFGSSTFEHTSCCFPFPAQFRTRVRGLKTVQSALRAHEYDSERNGRFSRVTYQLPSSEPRDRPMEMEHNGELGKAFRSGSRRYRRWNAELQSHSQPSPRHSSRCRHIIKQRLAVQQ